MLFNSLKYLRPIWYFNLRSKKDWGYFPTAEKIKHLFKPDNQYLSEEGKERDLAFTAFQSGYINKNYTSGLDIWEKVKIPVIDEYRFLRKNYHSVWVVYVLLLRLITFHNPFQEITGFIKTLSVKRVNYSKIVFKFEEYNTFKSELIESKPFLSLVIPTLNRYAYLKDVLKDLEVQDYQEFEVIIVDQTDPFQEEFYHGWNLNLKYWYQPEKALWKARNDAIKSAKGDYILLYDDDSRVDSNWIKEHLKVLDFFQADISSGVSLSTIGAEIPEHYSYFRWGDQLDTGNVLLKKSIFEEIGYFDLKFEKQRMGDGEFGLRAYLNGYKNISNPKAKRIHLKVSEGGLRQMGSWDGWRPKKIFGPRPVPSVLYLSRKYFGNEMSLYFILANVLPSYISYKYKKNKLLKLTAILFFPIFLPIIVFQVLKSWKLASQKLND